jgi:iron complex outermembrane receptor protein
MSRWLPQRNSIRWWSPRREPLKKVVDAPASVSVVPPEVVAARPALTSTDHIRAQPGIDISSGGLFQSNVVARGFNNIFSGALMTLTDNRFASVPSLAVNVPYLVPITNEDIERIEIVLGPGAALYGPNTANGVMNIITKSPFESPGASITAGGGIAASSGSSDVNIARTALRYASRVNDKVAFKLSGEYTAGKDWRFVDPAEPPAQNVISRCVGMPGKPDWTSDPRPALSGSRRTAA